MKTAIESPGVLFSSAKRAVVQCRTTLGLLIGRRLYRRLAQQTRPGKPTRIRWVIVEGGLPPGLDIASREQMARWIREGGSTNNRC